MSTSGKIFRVGIIGFAHMHINDVGMHYVEHPRTQIVAIADIPPEVPEARVAPYTRGWNMQFAKDHFGDINVYDCYKEMLEKENLDLVVVTCENARHREAVIACAKAGVAVSIEKPMAISMQDAMAMKRAAEAYGTLVFVNWPVAWNPTAHEMLRLVEAGEIGDVFEVRIRFAHTGPLGEGAKHAGVKETAAPMSGFERSQTWWHQTKMGGGAMLDFCGYGCLLSRWYMGVPGVAAMGMRHNFASQYAEADDNAAMLVRFPRGMAVLGASWTTMHSGVTPGPIIYGTKGTIVQVSGNELTLIRNDVVAPETITAAPLPAERADVASEFVYHMDTGAPLHTPLQLDFNLDAMAILDAGIRSAASGKIELVSDGSWTIG